jgi:pimeloyl-ACP methyl ester carboxylesterase
MKKPKTYPVFKTQQGRAEFERAYAAALDSWPVPFEALDVPTRFGTTHVIASGPKGAPAVVLLHCMAGTAVVWRPNVAALSQLYRTFAVDVPAQPNLSVLTRRIRNRQDQALWFTDLLDALGAPTASIVGNSYGGFLALSQACLTPERVDQLILISPAGTFTPFGLGFYLRMIPSMLFGGGADDTMQAIENGLPLEEEWKALVALAMKHGRMSQMGFGPRPLPPRELQRLKSAPLLIIGDRELMYRPEPEIALARSQVPGLEGRIAPDANHIAAMSNPELLNRWMLARLGDDAKGLASQTEPPP